MKKKIRKSIGILLVVVMLAALAPMAVMAYTDDDPTTRPASRAEVITLMWRAAGSPVLTGDNPFADVEEGAWYHDAVVWAVRRGIISVVSAETFDPDSPITLQEVIVLMWRHVNSPAVRAGALDNFPDAGEIAPWALAAMEWAAANNIIGRDGTYKPTGYVTHAQAELIIGRARQPRPARGRRAGPAWRVTTVTDKAGLLAALRAGYNVIYFKDEGGIEEGIEIREGVVILPGTLLIVQHGWLSVSGDGVLTVHGQLTLEGGRVVLVDSGELTVGSGGTLTVEDKSWIAVGVGVLTVDGRLIVEEGGFIDNYGTITVDGQLIVEEGGFIDNYGTITVDGQLIVENHGGINNFGTIDGGGTVTLGYYAITEGAYPGSDGGVKVIGGNGPHDQWH